MKMKYPEIGICGLSCRLCPSYHMDTKSRCSGCKSEGRMAVGCPFITCAIKNLEIEELKEALAKARVSSKGREIKEKSKLLHSILDDIAAQKKYHLKLRK